MDHERDFFRKLAGELDEEATPGSAARAESAALAGPAAKSKDDPGACDDDIVIVRYDDSSFLAQAAPAPAAANRPDSDFEISRDATEQLAREPEPAPDAAREGAPGDGEAEEPGAGAMASPLDSEPVAPPTEPAEEAAGAASVLGVDWDAVLGLKRQKFPSSSSRKPRPEPAPAPEPRPEAEAPAPPASSRIAALAAGPVLVGAAVLSSLRVEPFHTWLYLFAWFPFLALVNHFAAFRAPELSVFGPRARPALLLFAASVPVWLLFEALNFRLQDWYYVGVPDALLARRVGVILSFATVLPGLFFVEELLAVRGAFAAARTPEFPLSPATLRYLQIGGGALALAILALPNRLFPLVWIVPFLLLEPWFIRSGGTSLLATLAGGRPGRVYRLLVAGLICGIFWEAANFVAGGRWIYSVPGLDSTKIFEMPPIGFLGFPPFALTCWSLAKALIRLGVLPDWEGAPTIGPVEPPEPFVGPQVRRAIVGGLAVASLLVLAGMDRWTIDSFTPRPEDVPGIPDGVADWARPRGGSEVRGLLGLIDDGALYIPGRSSVAVVEGLREHCRLVLLRGIGTRNAARLDRVGVASIADLAAREPAELTAALAALDERGWQPRLRRVMVWVAAARRDAAD